MDSDAPSKEEEMPKEKALIERLRRFVEDSRLGFYEIASWEGLITLVRRSP